MFIKRKSSIISSTSLSILGLFVPFWLSSADVKAQEIFIKSTESDRRVIPLSDLAEFSIPSSTQAGMFFSDYRLGAGDHLSISVFAADEYDAEVIVRQDGSVNLPHIGKVFLKGLTLEQATEELTAKYAVFIRQPIIDVQPIQFRPVRIGIAGEISRPGSYIVSGFDDPKNSPKSGFPTLTQAISQAGGITSEANLRELAIRRDTGRGEKETLVVDLWDLIKSGNLDQDVILMSGDEVFIPKAIALTPEEITQLSDASFAPATIQVYIAGEVDTPGIVEVPLNTPLNQGLLASGGFNPRAQQNTVSLVRINADGTAAKQLIDVDFFAGVNDPNNPFLKDQDVIIVERSSIAKTNDVANLLLSPFSSALNIILSVFRLFN